MINHHKILLAAMAKALDDKKALDVSVLEISDLTIVTDYFVLATGTSSTHVRTLADEIDHLLSAQGIEPHHIEGRATGWVLLDYGSVVAHVFTKEARAFYNLDRLWSDGHPLDLNDISEMEASADATV